VRAVLEPPKVPLAFSCSPEALVRRNLSPFSPPVSPRPHHSLALVAGQAQEQPRTASQLPPRFAMEAISACDPIRAWLATVAGTSSDAVEAQSATILLGRRIREVAANTTAAGGEVRPLPQPTTGTPLVPNPHPVGTFQEVWVTKRGVLVCCSQAPPPGSGARGIDPPRPIGSRLQGRSSHKVPSPVVPGPQGTGLGT
jgi:hypothetical protein